MYTSAVYVVPSIFAACNDYGGILLVSNVSSDSMNVWEVAKQIGKISAKSFFLLLTSPS